MTGQSREQRAFDVGKIFTPAVPVGQSDLFAGRINEIRRIVDAVNQRGQHVAIFGDRGVGKTSLANIISSKLAGSAPILAPHITCDSTDDFSSLWRKVLSDIDLIQKKRHAGFQFAMFEETRAAADIVGDKVSPDDLRRLFTLMGDDKIIIVILDEFDRLEHRAARRAVADTIKTFSDHSAPVTVVIVGVAETVNDLVAEHESISRALVQVQMPRMKRSELIEILHRGTAKLGMTINDDGAGLIGSISQGLPYYTHLLGLHAARTALDRGEEAITVEPVFEAIAKAVDDSQASLKEALRKATTSPQRGNIFGDVLLACALSQRDDFGYFGASVVRGPLERIRRRSCGIPMFARHLKSFCQPARGRVLEKTGGSHRIKYRFTSPLMPPLVVMNGFVANKIGTDVLERST